LEYGINRSGPAGREADGLPRLRLGVTRPLEKAYRHWIIMIDALPKTKGPEKLVRIVVAFAATPKELTGSAFVPTSLAHRVGERYNGAMSSLRYALLYTHEVNRLNLHQSFRISDS
jgi:hypothetical protein